MLELGVQSYESQVSEAVPEVIADYDPLGVVAALVGAVTEPAVRTFTPHIIQGVFAPVVLFLIPRPKAAPHEPTVG